MLVWRNDEREGQNDMSDFQDVGDFHRKFQLPNVPDRDVCREHAPVPTLIDRQAAIFRLKFLTEELMELTSGVIADDLPEIADALIDLVYVAHGTAHLYGLPWEELWHEVQTANMLKVRCKIGHVFDGKGDSVLNRCGHEDALDVVCGRPAVEHSKRGSVLDVIKPEGWEKPDIKGILESHQWNGPITHDHEGTK